MKMGENRKVKFEMNMDIYKFFDMGYMVIIIQNVNLLGNCGFICLLIYGFFR